VGIEIKKYFISILMEIIVYRENENKEELESLKVRLQTPAVCIYITSPGQPVLLDPDLYPNAHIYNVCLDEFLVGHSVLDEMIKRITKDVSYHNWNRS
jgi:hypothetical protein